MFTFNTAAASKQIPLIHVVDQDDQILLNTPDAEWFRLLYFLSWQDYREIAAEYYNALYDFNKSRQKASNNNTANAETRQEAAQRLLFGRSTVDKDASVLAQHEFEEAAVDIVSPDSIAPGKTPQRLGGKKPKCFFALFKSFLGANILGFASDPEMVYSLLISNLPFARVCGFIPKGADEQYWYLHVPSLRKIEQFDQIMTEYGLWNKIKWAEVKRNIKEKVIAKENKLVGDTSHYYAYSGFETVTYMSEKGKEKNKSQSKPTKNCRCENQENCPHPWQLSDDGAGTIVKAHNKYIWGHKASILGLPLQGIPLDAVAVADGATFDGETLYPHLIGLFENLPEVEPWIDIVLYDSACDNQKLKEKIFEQFGIILKASLNPRRKKTILEGLPKGMQKLTPYGTLICSGDFEMEYKGARYDAEKFIYQAPINENGECVCSACEHKPTCCPHSNKGRVVTVPFDLLSHIDSNDPPMAKRFKAMMTHRPSVERMIKRLKCDLSDDRLKKRGNASFQASLDKTMIAFHILLRN